MTNLKDEDIATATNVLGYYIDIFERTKSKPIDNLKSCYLRLRLFSRIKESLSPQDSEERRETLRRGVIDGLVYPVWLPCHSAQSPLHSQQFMSPHDECHCAIQLGVLLDIDACFSSSENLISNVK